jgi:alpha-glucosidase
MAKGSILRMILGYRMKKNTILWLVCCILLVALRAAFAQTGPPAAAAQISQIPNGIELTDGSARLDVEIVEDRLVRVHVCPDGKETERTLVLDPHPALRPPAGVTRTDRSGVYTLASSGVTVQIKETSPFSISFLDSSGRQILRSADPLGEARAGGVTMLRVADDTLYGVHGLGLGETKGTVTRDDGGQVLAGVQGNSGAPFIFSVHYGLLVDSGEGDFVTAPGSLSFQHSSRPDVEYFVFVGPPLETMAALSRLVGPPPLPPRWTLGFLNSQWGSTQSEVENIVAKYRSEKIPIDGFILDFDWKAWGEDNYGEWRWNSTSGAGNVAPDKFPGGASGDFARELATEGVKLSGILKPRILMTVAGNPNQPTEAAAYATEHHFWYPGEQPLPDYFSHRMARDLDFSIADERSWYWQHLLPAFHAGMVGWWNDEADYDGDTVFNNFQFLNMGRTIYEGQRSDSNKRVWSINRTFFLGASRYAYAGWSGDIDSGFASMAFQTRRMIAALDTGEFHWSMDTGGFHGHPSSENYTRWIEFAAFVPIMRVHGFLDEKRQPWVYGPVAEAASRNAINLRYQLLPYIYSYQRLDTEGEIGLVRPLFWQFPSDAAAAAVDDEWMFGDSILVAPVLAEGATSREIYLPAGDWFDYESGRHYAGGEKVAVAVDAKTWADIPLFVRAGSIVATQPLEQYVGQNPVTEITLDIFPGDSSATFTVYDDDGDTYNYEKGAYLKQQISARRVGAETRVTVDAASGSYASQLRTYLLRIHSASNHVTQDGSDLSSAAAMGDLDQPGTHFLHQTDRFGPVDVLRVVAGAKTSSTITLR